MNFALDEQPTPDIPATEPARSAPDNGPDSVNTSIDAVTTPAITPITQPTTVPVSLPCPDMPADSIFNQELFPYTTKKYSCTPSAVKQLLEYWACSGDNIRAACEKYQIGYDVIRELQFKFTEIDDYHAHAQERKAHVYFESALENACDDSGDMVTVTRKTKSGDTLTYDQGNMVAVRRKELITHSYFAAAERLSARYRPKSETINRNLNVILQAKPPDIYKMQADDL